MAAKAVGVGSRPPASNRARAVRLFAAKVAKVKAGRRLSGNQILQLSTFFPKKT
jgi:hypothetical protein